MLCNSMAFIPAINTAEIALQFAQSDGEFAENTFYVESTGAYTSTILTALAQAFMDWWKTGDGTHSYRGIQSSLITLLGCTARDLTTQSSDNVTVAADETSNVGGGSADPLQNGLSKAITWRTGLSGRSFRGRTFLVGLTLDDLAAGANNQFNPTKVANYVSALTSLIAAVTAAEAACKLVVLSRYTLTSGHTAPRATGVMTPIISCGSHDLFVDFQRRRAPGHNRHH